MLRRDFFKALSAAAAALAAPKAVMAAAVPAAVTPPLAEPAVALGKMSRQVTPEVERAIALLKECRITSVEKVTSIHGPQRYIVSYRHNPEGQWTMLDEAYGFLAETGAPVNISVSLTADTSDLLDYDGYYTSAALHKAERIIDVEWIV